MHTHEKSATLKDLAKGRLSGNYSAAVLIYLLCNALTLIFTQSAVSMSISIENTIYRLLGSTQELVPVLLLSYALVLFVSILCEIFKVGLALFFLNIACGNPGNSFDLFYGFRQQFGKSLGICSVLSLLRVFCFLPVDIALYLYQKNHEIEPQTMIYLGIALIVGILIYLPCSLALSQSYFLLLDFPEYSAIVTMKLSTKIMKGHMLSLLYIKASMIPLFLLSVLSFGVASLWVTPFMNTTYSLFFLDIMKSE